ncbi:MAG TPA: ABC transporter permease, partial [Ilumatobacteraceae bacterium]|nr:ABC transporter permease [Ilumatobacteraceae bacterium]
TSRRSGVGWRQFWTSSRRYARSLVADRRSLFLILATGPVLGLVLLLRLPTDQLRSLAPDELPSFSRASAPLMLLALAMTQLGINLSARQIVRELPQFRRERAIGLSIPAYVASKFVVLAGVGAVQALLCVAIALARQGGPDEGAILSSGQAELVVVFFVTWLAGMTLGLLCSAIATSEARLNLVLPAILAFQTLAVTGTAVASLPSAPVLDQSEYVASASWGFNAAASTVELNRLNALNDALINADTAARGIPTGTIVDRLNPLNLGDPAQIAPRGNPDFDHDAGTWWRAMFMLVGLTVVALAATALALRRYAPL